MASLILPARPPGNLLGECALTRGFKQEGPASGVMLLSLARGRGVKPHRSLNISASPSFSHFLLPPKDKKLENLNSALVVNVELASVSSPHWPLQTEITAMVKCTTIPGTFFQ